MLITTYMICHHQRSMKFQKLNKTKDFGFQTFCPKLIAVKKSCIHSLCTAGKLRFKVN